MTLIGVIKFIIGKIKKASESRARLRQLQCQLDWSQDPDMGKKKKKAKKFSLARASKPAAKKVAEPATMADVINAEIKKQSNDQ